MRTIHLSLIVALMLTGCAGRSADRGDKKPSAAPRAAAGETPQQAITRYARTFDTGNTTACMALFEVKNDRDRRIVEPFVKYNIALAKMERAMTKKFDRAAADAAMHAAGEKTETDARTASVLVNGDMATVTFADKSTSTLKRVNGVWLVPMDESVPKMSDDEVKAYASDYEAKARAMDDVTQKITEGRYAKADEAVAAVAQASKAKRPT